MSKLTPIILIIFSAILFWKYIDPVRVEITDLRASNEEYTRILDRVNTLSERRNQLQKKYTSISEANLTKIKNMVPDDNNNKNVKLVLDIDRMVSKRGLSVKNIAISDPSGGKPDAAKKSVSIDTRGFGTTVITFSVSTTYSNFLLLLNDLENSLRLVDVTSLKITPKDTGINEYSVTLNTYWLK